MIQATPIQSQAADLYRIYLTADRGDDVLDEIVQKVRRVGATKPSKQPWYAEKQGNYQYSFLIPEVNYGKLSEQLRAIAPIKAIRNENEKNVPVGKTAIELNVTLSGIGANLQSAASKALVPPEYDLPLSFDLEANGSAQMEV